MNITVGEIIIFFVIMLRISIEPQKMVGYPSYFVEDTMIHLGCLYYVQLTGYDAWGRYVVTLIRFKQIRRVFHPEYGTSFLGEKYHQPHYFICVFNDKSKVIVFLGAW